MKCRSGVQALPRRVGGALLGHLCKQWNLVWRCSDSAMLRKSPHDLSLCQSRSVTALCPMLPCETRKFVKKSYFGSQILKALWKVLCNLTPLRTLKAQTSLEGVLGGWGFFSLAPRSSSAKQMRSSRVPGQIVVEVWGLTI